MTKCIFIFRRDLRLNDNTCLIHVLQKYNKVLPVFIYDHNQINKNTDHPFLGPQECALNDLESYLNAKESRLCRFYGTPHKIIKYLIQEYKPDAVAFNKDYSYYSLERDMLIKNVCQEFKVELVTQDDIVTYNISLNYFNKKFSEFVKNITKHKTHVHKNGINKYDKQIFGKETIKRFGTETDLYTRKKAIEAIKKDAEKDFGISVHMKLGLISCREVYKYAVENNRPVLAKNMLWRDFFFACFIQHLREKKNNYDFYDSRYSAIEWLDNKTEIKALWSAKTGYALIDAAVNQLNTTGFMSNRGRLIVGFFSVKILRINPWLKEHGGQSYFSNHLMDCCYANNTGNWHWVASDTVDASGQRFGKGWSGRPANPELLSHEDKIYIEKWLPYKINKAPPKIVDWRIRWKEWREFTKK